MQPNPNFEFKFGQEQTSKPKKNETILNPDVLSTVIALKNARERLSQKTEEFDFVSQQFEKIELSIKILELEIMSLTHDYQSWKNMYDMNNIDTLLDQISILEDQISTMLPNSQQLPVLETKLAVLRQMLNYKSKNYVLEPTYLL